MKALTWHGQRDVRVDTVPDPTHRAARPTRSSASPRPACAAPTCTSTRCSARSWSEGDILGHEPMGIVEEVGAGGRAPRRSATASSIPFNISCGHCFMCDHGPAVAVRDDAGARAAASGAALFGYTKLYGQVPGGQAEFLRVPQAHYGPIKVPEGPPDDRFLFLSDVLPTAWQAVEYADDPRRRQRSP